MRTEKEFMDYFRGLPNNVLQTACNRACFGIDWRGSTKASMAENYAGKTHKSYDGLSKVDLSKIGYNVVVMYGEKQISSSQSIPAFKWLRKAGLSEATSEYVRRHR